MKRIASTVALLVSSVALSASVVLAAPPDGATGHGAKVSAVAHAVDAVSGRAHGEAVSAIAKTHGAAVSAAARAKGAAASAPKAKGAAAGAAGKAKGAAASEPGRLKSAAGQADQP